MNNNEITITSSEGGEFDAYLALPDLEKAPAIIAIPDIFGVRDDFKALCDDFAESGFIVIAPDLFWRTDDPGVLSVDEDGKRRGFARANPRQERIEAGLQDITDTVSSLKTLSAYNGKVAVMGFCYGGPFAIIGPSRLGLDAGFAFHGSAMETWIDEFKDVEVPVSLHWGKNDQAVSEETMQLYKTEADKNSNIDLHVYDNAPHGYTIEGRPAYNAESANHSFACAKKIMESLR